ncbi:MAG: hypothetical protein AAF749_14575 [Pseudomonadota bacterium]
MNEQENLEVFDAPELIEDFSVDPSHYRELATDDFLLLESEPPNLGATKLYGRGDTTRLSFSLKDSGIGNRVFFGDGVRGRLSLGITGNNATIFIGRDVSFSDQHIGSRHDGDCIAIGNDVSTTGPGRWISGLRCGDPCEPKLVIGDACVIARDVVLRNSDGHPFFDPKLEAQVLPATNTLVIEPHVWLGERCAIIKPVRIGAFAVVGFSAVITANIPAHHSAFGNPAVTKLNDCKVWCWDDTEAGLERASRYLARFPYPK